VPFTIGFESRRRHHEFMRVFEGFRGISPITLILFASLMTRFSAASRRLPAVRYTRAMDEGRV